MPTFPPDSLCSHTLFKGREQGKQATVSPLPFCLSDRDKKALQEILASVDASYISLVKSRLHGYPFWREENLSEPL